MSIFSPYVDLENLRKKHEYGNVIHLIILNIFLNILQHFSHRIPIRMEFYISHKIILFQNIFFTIPPISNSQLLTAINSSKQFQHINLKRQVTKRDTISTSPPSLNGPGRSAGLRVVENHKQLLHPYNFRNETVESFRRARIKGRTTLFYWRKNGARFTRSSSYGPAAL